MVETDKKSLELVVSADAADVRQVLEDALTAGQRRAVRVRPSTPSPFAPTARHDAELAWAAVSFVGSALAGGVIYDLARAALVKAFGARRVKAKPAKAKAKRPAKAGRKIARPAKARKRVKRR